LNRPAYHITKAVLVLLFSFVVYGCTQTPEGKGRRLIFEEVNTAKGLKLIAVYAYNESDTESSNSWNNYTVEVRDPATGNLDFSTKFHNDAYNDAGAVLHCSANYAFINANEYKAVSLTEPNVILNNKDILKRIEDKNPDLKANIAETSTFNVNYLRLISKQGYTYIVSLNTFDAYSCGCLPNTTIDDSLSFWFGYRYPLENIAAPNYKQWVLQNDSTTISLEYETINNITKKFLFSYPYRKDFYNRTNQATRFVSDGTANPYSHAVDETSKTPLYPKPFLVSSMIGLVNGSLYISHHSELGDSAKELLTKFDLDKNAIDWSIDLNKSAGAIPGDGMIGFTKWSKDFKSVYFNNTSQEPAIHKLDAISGKVIYTLK
jgi:hypothetical protein